MHKKWSIPLIISIIIMTLSIFLYINIYNRWQDKDIHISNPIINNIDTHSQTVDLKTIIHETEKHVVQIEGQNEDSTITGSGFLYNDQGDIITNAHVIEDANVIYVRTSNAHIYSAAVIGIGENTDIAVIRVPELAEQSFLTVENEIPSEIGDEIIALGSPHGFQNTVTLGIISGSERNFSVDGYDYSNVYQISAQITHGNSGGPLIHRQTGNVIGINSVGTQDGTIGFSIPIKEVIDQIEQWSNETANDQLEFASTTDIVNKFDPELLQEDANYLIDYFFESIQMRDYINSYTLLGSAMQSDISYTDFRNDYTHIVDLDYSEVSSNITEERHSETFIDVTIESKPKNKDKTKVENIEYKFIIGFENDQLRILKISTS